MAKNIHDKKASRKAKVRQSRIVKQSSSACDDPSCSFHGAIGEEVWERAFFNSVDVEVSEGLLNEGAFEKINAIRAEDGLPPMKMAK